MDAFLAGFIAATVVWNVAPPGTPLHVRLTHAVGSYASRPHSRVEAVLIAPVKSGDETILPAGSLVSGEVKSVRRVGLGVIHEPHPWNSTSSHIRRARVQVLATSTPVGAVDEKSEVV